MRCDKLSTSASFLSTSARASVARCRYSPPLDVSHLADDDDDDEEEEAGSWWPPT
jgi:hypothetical protein